MWFIIPETLIYGHVIYCIWTYIIFLFFSSHAYIYWCNLLWNNILEISLLQIICEDSIRKIQPDERFDLRGDFNLPNNLSWGRLTPSGVTKSVEWPNQKPISAQNFKGRLFRRTIIFGCLLLIRAPRSFRWRVNCCDMSSTYLICHRVRPQHWSRANKQGIPWSLSTICTSLQVA